MQEYSSETSHQKYGDPGIDFIEVELENDEFFGYQKKQLGFISQLHDNFKENNFYEGMSKEAADIWYDKVCGITCLAMAIEFHTKKVCRLKELLDFRDHYNQYIDPATNEEKQHTYYQPGVGWTHRGLVRIAEKYGLKGTVYKETQESLSSFKMFLREKLENPYTSSLINSVSIGFEENINGKQGGHLVVLKKIAEDIILIHDPYMLKPIKVNIEKLYKSNTFRFIELRK